MPVKMGSVGGRAGRTCCATLHLGGKGRTQAPRTTASFATPALNQVTNPFFSLDGREPLTLFQTLHGCFAGAPSADCAVEFVGLTSREVHAMTKMTDPLTQALRGLFNVGQRLRSRWTLGGPACAARQVWMHTFAMCSSSCCCACARRFSVTMPWASCNKSPPFKTSCAFAAARAKQPEMVSCHSCARPTVPLYSAR